MTIENQNITLAGHYTNSEHLDKLKRMSYKQKEHDKALQGAAEQFEALYLAMMLKNMRKAGSEFNGDINNSESVKLYQSMLDQQLSLNIAGNGGIGLAKQLMTQLKLNSKSI